MQQMEAFLGERKEDVVLRRKVAVERCRAVFDALGNLSNRNVLVTLVDEQLARRVENRSADGLPVPFLAFLDAHSFGCLPEVNSVRSYNIVRRKNDVEVSFSGK